jgi:hypothetical protein
MRIVGRFLFLGYDSPNPMKYHPERYPPDLTRGSRR